MNAKRCIRGRIVEALNRSGRVGRRLFWEAYKTANHALPRSVLCKLLPPVAGPGLADISLDAPTRELLADLRRRLSSADFPVPGVVQHADRRDFQHARVAVVAHWDSEGLADPYVLHYGRELQRLGWTTVLASEQAVRLPPSVPLSTCGFNAIVHRTCPGYDFTSWKAAFGLLPSILEAEELLLTNDSIFAPVGDLGAAHEAMDAVSCDFWGMVESRERRPHLQSYYLVFRAAALRNQAFADFWKLVAPSADREQSIGHELAFSAWLAAAGLRPGAYSPVVNQIFPQHNPTHCSWFALLHQCHAPFVKRDLIFANPLRFSLRGLRQCIEASGYPICLIEDYGARRGFRPLYDK